jgi:hypothetical protein
LRDFQNCQFTARARLPILFNRPLPRALDKKLSATVKNYQSFFLPCATRDSGAAECRSQDERTTTQDTARINAPTKARSHSQRECFPFPRPRDCVIIIWARAVARAFHAPFRARQYCNRCVKRTLRTAFSGFRVGTRAPSPPARDCEQSQERGNKSE